MKTWKILPNLFLAAMLCCCCGTPADPDGDDGKEKTCARPGYDCDVSLDPPAAGLQIKVGPYPVPPGSEVLRCYWRKVPADLDVGRIQVAYNHGSHHVDIYGVPYPMPDGDFDCSDSSQWGTWPQSGVHPDESPRMVVGFQNDSIDWTLPQGTSYKLTGGQQLLVQSHYANATTQKTPTDTLLDYINFVATSDPMPAPAATLFDEDTALMIAPGETTVTRVCEFPRAVSLIGMFTHFHSRGKDFKVYSYDPATKAMGDLLYENQDWTSPPWKTWDGDRLVSGLMMVAKYQNDTGKVIPWGYYVEKNEHMETYAMFSPAVDLGACPCHREGESCP